MARAGTTAKDQRASNRVNLWLPEQEPNQDSQHQEIPACDAVQRTRDDGKLLRQRRPARGTDIKNPAM